MKTFLIAFEPKDPRGDYTALHDAIKALGNGWWHYLNNIWLISSSSAAVTIREKLAAHVEDDGALFVISLGANWAAHNLSPDGLEWLRDHLISETEAIFGEEMVLPVKSQTAAELTAAN